MGVRTVTARWVNGDGSPVANALTTFEIDPSVYSTDEMVVGTTTIEAIADANGLMGTELWTNEEGLEPSRYTVTWPSGRQDAFVLSPGDTPISLRELLGMQLPGWIVPTDETAIDIAVSGVYDALANASDPLLGDAMVGTLYPPGLGVPRSVHDKLSDSVSIFDIIPKEQHAAIWAGTSTWDAAPALNAAFAWSRANLRPLKAEGGTFIINSTVEIGYHCDFIAATFMTDDINIIAVQVGITGLQLTRLWCQLPRIYCRGYIAPAPPVRPLGSGWGTGVGLRVVNIQQSLITTRHLRSFNTNLQVVAEDGFQSAYGRYEILQNEDGKRSIVCTPQGTGYINENQFVGGRTSLNSSEGVRQPGTASILLEGGIRPVNNNRFHYMSMEGKPEYKIHSIGAQNNLWNFCRYETTDPDHPWVKFAPYVSVSPPQTTHSTDNVIWYGFDSDDIHFEDDAAQLQNHIYTNDRLIFNGRSPYGVIRGSNANSPTSPIFAATVSKYLMDIEGDPNITWYASENDMVVKGQNDTSYRARFTSATGLLEMAAADDNPTMALSLIRLRMAAATGTAGSVVVNNTSDPNAPAFQVLDDAAGIATTILGRAGASVGQLNSKFKRPRIGIIGDLGPRVQIDHYNGRVVIGDGLGEAFLITMLDATGQPATAGTFTVAWPTTATPTPAQPWNVSTAALATALSALFGSGNVLSVTGTAGVQYIVRVGGTLIDQRIPPPIVDGAGLTPAGAVQATLADPWIGRFISNVLLISDGYKLNPTIALNPAVAGNRGVVRYVEGAAGVADRMVMQRKNASDQYGWTSMLGDALIAVSAFASSGNVIDTFTVGTADTVVFTTTIPGGTLGTINKIRVSLIGKLLNNSGGNVTFNIRTRYGGIVVCNITTAAIPTNSADRPIDFEVTLSGRQSASFQAAKSTLMTGNGAGSAGVQSAVSSVYTAVHMTNALNANSNNDQTLNISLSMTPAGASAGLVVFTVSTVHIEAIH